MPKQLPTFNSEQEEQDFWANADSADYVDWSQVRWVVLPHRKPSTQTISLRLPEHLVDSLKLQVTEKRLQNEEESFEDWAEVKRKLLDE